MVAVPDAKYYCNIINLHTIFPNLIRFNYHTKIKLVAAGTKQLRGRGWRGGASERGENHLLEIFGNLYESGDTFDTKIFNNYNICSNSRNIQLTVIKTVLNAATLHLITQISKQAFLQRYEELLGRKHHFFNQATI